MASFPNVPMGVGDDTTITIQPVGDGVYRLDPYPFAEDEMTFAYVGRPVMPQPPEVDLKPYLSSMEPIEEQVVLVR